MDNNQKQHFSRQNTKTCQSVESNSKTPDTYSAKYWPRNDKRRENNSTVRKDQTRNSSQSSKTRPNVDKRPRSRTYDNNNLFSSSNQSYNEGDANNYEYSDNFASASTGLAHDLLAEEPTGKKKLKKYQLNSVCLHGNKKQSLNHLTNFKCTRYNDYPIDMNLFGRRGDSSSNKQRSNQVVKKQKFNKKQFLQANFQFVVNAIGKPSVTASPDILIDWNLIEQVNIQTTEEPRCPICLQALTAAKLTSCGHPFCWGCMLTYFAFAEKPWRPCPVCFEPINVDSLKSTTILQQRPINVENEITFELMCRKKDSMFFEKYSTAATKSADESFPYVSSESETKLFSKFLIANHADILDIMDREERELIRAMESDETAREIMFKQQALALLKMKREQLGEDPLKSKNNDLTEKGNSADITNANMQELNNAVEDAGEVTNVTTTNVGKYFYFYQSDDGQNIYLHPLNVKMLQACYGSLDKAPRTLKARILQKEYHSMDEERRRKFTCLGHLPLTCQFAIVEVNLKPPIINQDIMELFENDLLKRKTERQRRNRDERRREKQINEINDRQMGKLIATTTNLNLNSSYEFPTMTVEDFPLRMNDDVDGINIINEPPTAAKPIPTKTNKQHASYSTVAVIGGSPNKDFWPTLGTPSPSNSNNTYLQELTSSRPTKPIAVNNIKQRTTSERSSEAEFSSELTPVDVKLSDVLAEAFSQKKKGGGGSVACHTNNGGNGGNVTIAAANKKNKKNKKMLPLFSTGMNFNGK